MTSSFRSPDSKDMIIMEQEQRILELENILTHIENEIYEAPVLRHDFRRLKDGRMKHTMWLQGKKS